MKKRTITKISDLQLKPFDRYGKPIPKLSWHPISYDKKSNHGSYILKFKAGGKSLKHNYQLLKHKYIFFLVIAKLNLKNCLQYKIYLSIYQEYEL